MDIYFTFSKNNEHISKFSVGYVAILILIHQVKHVFYKY